MNPISLGSEPAGQSRKRGIRGMQSPRGRDGSLMSSRLIDPSPDGDGTDVAAVDWRLNELLRHQQIIHAFVAFVVD